MGKTPANAEGRLKISKRDRTVHTTPPCEKEEADTEALATSGALKINRRKTTEHPHEERTPKSAAYPWHSLSPRKSESLETSDIILEAATVTTDSQPFDWISIVFQPLGALLAIVVLLVILHFTGAGMSMGLYMLIGGVTGVLGILWGVIRYRTQKKNAENAALENAKKYRAYLRTMRQALDDTVEKQQRILNADFPSAHQCASFDENTIQLWNCDLEDTTFLSVRLGSGSRKLSRRVVPPASRYSEENHLNEEARALAAEYAYVNNIPITCDLRAATTLGVVGDRNSVVSQAISLVVCATARHSYEDLKVVFIYPESEKRIWGEARFLPHVFDDSRDYRFMADNAADAKEIVLYLSDLVDARKKEQSSYGFSSGHLFRPHYLVVFADTSLGYMLRADDPELGVSCVYLASSVNRLPSHCQQIAELNADGATFYNKSSADVQQLYTPDHLSNSAWEEYVHRMAPIRLETPKIKAGIPRTLSFLQMFNVQAPEQLGVGEKWRDGKPDETLETIIGAKEDSSLVTFDISPNKCGPNGIFIGTTRTGKTSMVRTWILSMATSYSPEDVNFVLIDFREPGLINGLERLPHIVGTLGTLDAASGDIYRNLVALKSEMQRRQEMLKKAQSVSIYDYRRKHSARNEAAKDPLSFLFIVVDELNELKSWDRDNAGTEWMGVLDSLYQKGSGLGIHIIAGSQTTLPFSSVMDGNANFRWCLRTQTKAESQALLGYDYAYHIRNKGRTFMRVGGDITEFQSAFADDTYFTQSERRMIPERELVALSLKGERKALDREFEDRPTELELTVDYISSYANRNHIEAPWRVWLERLPNHVLLEELPEVERTNEKKNALCAIVGLLDDPATQPQNPILMQIDLFKRGSFLIYGAARTGKTAFLQSFAYSLLVNNSPEFLEMFIIESNVGDFFGFESFPQVKRIISSDSANEIVDLVSSILSKRKKRASDKKDTRIVLIVDGLNALMGDYERKAKVLDIVQNGSGLGIFLVGSAMNMIGTGSVAQIGAQTKFGLSFWVSHSSHDYHDLIHDKEINALPPRDIPGRGITSIDRVVSFQVARLFTPENEERQRESLRNKASMLWGNSQPYDQPKEGSRGHGEVILGKKLEADESILHYFTKSTSLLVVCDDYDRRLSIMSDIIIQLLRTTSVKEIIGVDLPEKSGLASLGIKNVHSGSELDGYLLNMKDDLNRRSKEEPAAGTTHPPYVFTIPDFSTCLERSRASQSRIYKNLIVCGKVFSVFTLIGCSYKEFDEELAKEMEMVSKNNGGNVPVPLMSLARGKCLLLDVNKTTLNDFFVKKYIINENGNYYLAGEEAISIHVHQER